MCRLFPAFCRPTCSLDYRVDALLSLRISIRAIKSSHNYEAPDRCIVRGETLRGSLGAGQEAETKQRRETADSRKKKGRLMEGRAWKCEPRGRTSRNYRGNHPVYRTGKLAAIVPLSRYANETFRSGKYCVFRESARRNRVAIYWLLTNFPIFPISHDSLILHLVLFIIPTL